MKFLKQIFSRILALMLAVLIALPTTGALAESDGMIRVKITRLGTPSSITFQTTCDYYVSNRPELRISSGSTVTLTASDSTITATVGSASASFDGSLKLMRSRSGSYGVKFTSPKLSNLYCGDLFLTASGGKITTILNIYVEDYLYGVVGYEMSPSWKLEALKAQAVAARNYALIKKQSRANKSYHVTDNTGDQVFKGLNTAYTNVIHAVDGSRGVVLTYGGSPVQCYYSASNGGQTESTKNVWGGKLGYSVVKDDPYDYASNATVKSATVKKDASGLRSELQTALIDGVRSAMIQMGVAVAENGVKIDRINSVTACNPRYAEPSRVYQTLKFGVTATVRNEAGEVRSGALEIDIPTFGGFESWYGLSINSSKNETVWVEENDSAFVVRFRRNGHGVGMSQCGAQEMAKNHGMTAAQILEFYYPGTTVGRLNLSDTTSDQRPSATPAPTETPAPTATPTPSQGYRQMGTAKAVSGASIYSGANPAAEKLASVRQSEFIKVYAVQGEWAAVSCGGRFGFMPLAEFSVYLPADSEVTTLSDCYAKVNASGGAVLRALAIESSARRDVVKKDALVRVFAYTDGWAAVMTEDGQAGFIAKELLTPVAAPTPTPQPTPAPESDGVVVVQGTKYVYISAASARMYRNHSTTSKLLKTLPYGTQLQIGAYNDEWACVRSGNIFGYIQRALLTADSPVARDENDVITAEFFVETTCIAPVFSLPDEQKLLGMLKKGQRLTVYAYNSEHAFVGLGDNRGFVALKNLKIVV